jgi:peptide/nickel transport system ATP-binding protein
MTTVLRIPRLRAPFGSTDDDPRVVDDVRASDSLVRIEDLHVSFERGNSRVNAVRGVTLAVAPGEILGLVGESGSGKSVLGLTLLGLLPASPAPSVQGSAVVRGTDMVCATPEERRLVRRRYLGAVFQDPMTSLNPTMRVGRQVAEAAGGDGKVLELLDSVGIPDARRRMQAYPHELSGGLRQRVMIAMAIAGSPSLVIADEPTTALDVTVQAQILELLRSLCDRMGTSFILITHDLGVAAQISDRIAVLYGGRLAEVGKAGSMFADSRHPYTRGLLKSRLLLDSDRARPIRTLPGEPPDPRAHPPGCAFEPRCSNRSERCRSQMPELTALNAEDRPTDAVACFNPVKEGHVATTQEASDPWTPITARAGGRDPAVLVHDVHKEFGARSGWSKVRLQALRGVSLEVDKGESVALVGESGCGKSTLLRTIAGLYAPNRGGVEFSRGTTAQMVFQDAGASLTPWLTIGELISERLRGEPLNRHDKDERVRDALSLVGLPEEVARAKPAQLSGGQCQRAALARATVLPPGILLCDEPTSALDVSLAATVLNLIGRLRRELDMAVLFVTHDLAAARIVADRIAVMYLGQVVESGPSDQICSNPTHPYTKALLAAVPDRGLTAARVSGEPANPLDPPAGCAFHTRCPDRVAECEGTKQTLISIGPIGISDRLVACSRFAPAQAGTSSPAVRPLETERPA